jgi:hypothetical protein
MPQARITKIVSLGVGAALAALLVCANSPAARAGDGDDGSNTSFTDKLLKTIGIQNPGETQYEINYSERSPLVVPPNRDLPPPISTNTKPVPNWPKDPDIERRKAAKNENKPVIRQGDSVIEDERALRPDELNVRGVTPPGVGEQSTPSERGEKKNVFTFDWLKNKDDKATFTGEPPRASLTDPPPGYLTPSPDQPYGLAPEHKQYVPKTLGERMEPTR